MKGVSEEQAAARGAARRRRIAEGRASPRHVTTGRTVTFGFAFLFALLLDGSSIVLAAPVEGGSQGAQGKAAAGAGSGDAQPSGKRAENPAGAKPDAAPAATAAATAKPSGEVERFDIDEYRVEGADTLPAA